MSSDMRSIIRDHLAVSASAFATLSTHAALHDAIMQAAEMISEAFARGDKLYVAGNGGSAADAQHFTAELVGWYRKGDRPKSAIALTTDTSFLTAWGNDNAFDNIFARQLEAHAQAGDVFFAISTSGNSRNILEGLETAQKLGLKRIGLLGPGGLAAGLCDIVLAVPAQSTPHIQELHTAVIHALCRCIER